MQLIKAYKTTCVLNGLNKAVLISIEVDTEHDLDLSYMDAALRRSTLQRLERGSLACVWVKVSARFADLSDHEGIDSLGQVFYDSESDLMETVQIHDMEKNAITHLIREYNDYGKRRKQFEGGQNVSK